MISDTLSNQSTTVDSPTDQSLVYTSPPTHVLPPAIRDFVVDHARSIDIDPGLVLPATLAGLAAAIGNSTSVEVKPGWVEPCIVFAAVVAESGSGKTPAMAGALKPIDQRAATEACMVKDITIEALADQLSQNPRGLLVYRDELDGWFGSFNQYKSGGSDETAWGEVWQAKRLMVHRKSAEAIKVPHAGVCVVGTIQPGTLARTLTDKHKDSGLAARFLWALPPRREPFWSDFSVSDTIADRYATVFHRLYQLPMNEGDADEMKPRELPLSDDGSATFARFFDEWAECISDREGALVSAYVKLRAYAPRLALILHLAGSPSPVKERTVSAESVAAGIALVRWFGHEADRIYATLSGDQGPLNADQLMEWVRRHPEQATVRKFTNSGPRKWRGDSEGAKFLAAELVRAGRLEWVYPPQEGGGRPRDKWLRIAGPENNPGSRYLDAGNPHPPLEE